MRFFLRGMLKGLVVLLVVISVSAGLIMAFLHSPFFRYPTDGEYPPPRISRLVWPTVGYPALVLPAGSVEVEIDLSGEGGGEQPGEVSGWAASITPARDELAGLSYPLRPVDSWIGPSGRWPETSRGGRYASVWHVEFEVPEEAVPELYDLSIQASVSGRAIADTQPHALAVTSDDDNDFTYVTMADIHVHERDNSTILSRQTDKGIGKDGEPLFFEEAIAQVNLIKPDFVLMLGDYIRGQRRPGELLTEYERFYNALMELEVPAFILPGNHDQYINEIDGARYFEENMGPRYFSFDVGDCHFTCLNTYQWPEEDRVVMNKLAFMEPRKWQGQALGFSKEGDGEVYTDQLAWLEEDLADHDSALLKVMALHHDPYTPEGEAYSWQNLFYWVVYQPTGGGEGREALLELASEHRVDMVFGGHRHVDDVGEVPWEDGGGETVYSCQTCVYFAGGGRAERYPGYRLVKVEDAYIASFSYLDGRHSYPLYEGSSLEGETDLDALDQPALWVEELTCMGGGGVVFGWEVGSFLDEEVELAGLVAEVPAEPAGKYEVEDGEIYRSVAVPGRPGWILVYVRIEAGPGTNSCVLRAGP